MIQLIDSILRAMVEFGNNALFFNIFFWSKDFKMPFLIAWILFACLFFSYKLKFRNLLFISHGFKSLFSKSLFSQQKKDKIGHRVSQETSRDIVSFTIGSCLDLGSMFGVALMVKIGGLGSIFWVMISGFLATSVRFFEVFCGHHYRKIHQNYHYAGGPQVYIREIFFGMGMNRAGKVLAAAFSIMLIVSTFASPQLNQTMSTIKHFLPTVESNPLPFSVLLSFVVIFIVAGKFSRIIGYAGKLVSIMSKFYFVVAGIIILVNVTNLPSVLYEIFANAFSLKAGISGFLATFVIAIQRGFFCNESGMGSGSISHANSVNKDSIDESIISMTTPIMTTSLVCVTSGLIVAVTGAYKYGDTGLEIMIYAFKTIHPLFHYSLMLLVPMFGISTAIAWAYYGQRAFDEVFGHKMIIFYNIALFLAYVICSASNSFTTVLNLADITNLAITIPNIFSLYFASKLVVSKTDEYVKKNKTINY